MRISLIALIVGILSLICCAVASGDDGPVPDALTLTGSVRLDDPSALPVGAVLTVTLEDVSLADAPAVTLGQAQIGLKGQQSPIPFSLVYPSSAVTPGSVCAARARVTLGDRLLFTTTDHYQVDALHPAPIELALSPVGVAAAPVPAPDVPAPVAPPVPDVSLTETYWKLTEVGGTPVQVSDQIREPYFVLHGQDNRFAGSGGVNQLMGGYTLSGDALAFSNTASTMMAGPPEAMSQEQAITTALPIVRSFSINGNQLTLFDEFRQPVLKAVAVALN